MAEVWWREPLGEEQEVRETGEQIALRSGCPLGGCWLLSA